MANLAASDAVALWPIALYFGLVVMTAVAMVALSHFLGERHNEPQTGQPYESGILSTDSARVRLSVKFYLMAVFFVVFDLESIFIFAWAVAVRGLGWAGYIEIVIFVGLLIAALGYLWRQGGLDWSPRHRSEP
jgi:NADH-quinone oxidoreductase subunit A